MAHEWLGSVFEGPENATETVVCSGNLSRTSCYLGNPLLGESHAIAGTRMIVSSLSIIGAISIIFTAIAKRQVTSPKVHPIFALSVADLMLALLWVVGGTLWLRQTPGMHKTWCFAVSLPTMVLQGVTVNLTLVYALLAYATIKQTDSASIINLDRPQNKRVWHPFKIFLAYFIAWTLPVAIHVVVLAVSAGRDRIVEDTRRCSCWCIPTYGNILPFANSIDEPSAKYVFNVNKILAFYGLVEGSNYLVVFILLIIIYHKTLKRIRRLKADVAVEQGRQSEQTQLLIQKGEFKARKRVLYFLASFLFTGFFNVVLSYAVVISLSRALSKGPQLQVFRKLNMGSPANTAYIVLMLLQSVTLPIQGFLNAMVYGWTREDFIELVSANSDVHPTEEAEMEVSQEDGSLESSGNHLSVQDQWLTLSLGLGPDSEEDG